MAHLAKLTVEFKATYQDFNKKSSDRGYRVLNMIYMYISALMRALLITPYCTLFPTETLSHHLPHSMYSHKTTTIPSQTPDQQTRILCIMLRISIRLETITDLDNAVDGEVVQFQFHTDAAICSRHKHL